jgi:methylamine dehydrogenase accessory protein MauD
MMDWLVVSNVALWIGFLVMVLINLALARQIGVLYERIAPAGALMMNRQLTVGQQAPEISVNTLAGEAETIGRPVDGRSRLLFFLSPDCPVCGSLIPVLRSARKAESGWLDILLASDGDEPDHQTFVRNAGLEDFPYIVSELLGKTFGVSKLPYAVLIDENGRIASMGIINSREHLESLFEAKEHKVASIQEYMQSKSTKTSQQGVRYTEASKS